MLIAVILFFHTAGLSRAAAVSDTTFPDYATFSKLSKKAILRQFGHKESDRRLIRSHYRTKHKGIAWIIPALIFIGAGVFFASVASHATNGMGGVVGLVLSIFSFIPGLISLYLFLKNFVFRRKPSRMDLYNELKKQYYPNR